jgi:alkylhydroperoxidase/carboxymuconolactone decarboxylase family protein YurZ
MDSRRATIVEFAVLAARPEFHSALQAKVRDIHDVNTVSRDELYECSLQTYLFAGFPAALEAVRVLNRAWPTENYAVDIENLRRDVLAYECYLERGEAFYQKVYGANAEVVKNALLKLSPELTAWAVIEGYGKTLSRPNLDLVTRELAIVGILTQLGWERQLFSHLMGGRNVGASLDELHDAISIGARGDEKKLETGDELLNRIRIA